MKKKQPSIMLIVLAFAAVYIIWGSTYFFIQVAVKHFPPMVLGGIRFLLSGSIMMLWVLASKQKLWNKEAILHSVISGMLMSFVGNGAVIWVEQSLPSSFVAIFIASSPIWFLLLDKPNWAENFSNKYTLLGVGVGLIGVVFLFYEKIVSVAHGQSFWPLIIILIGNIGWVLGSLYSKYRVKNISPTVNSAWQMFSAGAAFMIIAIINGSIFHVDWASIPSNGWQSLAYLVVFGSLIGYSAYVFLLEHRSPTQVSSYAYVNPLVAVLLGLAFNNEKLTFLQIVGLVVIVGSVYFINLAKKYRLKNAKSR